MQASNRLWEINSRICERLFSHSGVIAKQNVDRRRNREMNFIVGSLDFLIFDLENFLPNFLD